MKYKNILEAIAVGIEGVIDPDNERELIPVALPGVHFVTKGHSVFLEKGDEGDEFGLYVYINGKMRLFIDLLEDPFIRIYKDHPSNPEAVDDAGAVEWHDGKAIFITE